MSHSHPAAARISRSASAWILIFIFLLLALSISIGGYDDYLSVRKVVKDRACQQLSAVADLKAGQIDAWRKEMVHDAEVIRSNAFCIEHRGNIMLSDFRRVRAGEGAAGRIQLDLAVPLKLCADRSARLVAWRLFC